jgi:hypothetical protein
VSVAQQSLSGLSVRTIVREHESWFDVPRPWKTIRFELVAEQRDWFAAVWRRIQEGERVSVRAAYGDWFFPCFVQQPDGNWHRLPVAEDLVDLARAARRERVVAVEDSTDARVVIYSDGGGIFARRRVRTHRGAEGGGAKRRASADWEVIRDRREILRLIGNSDRRLSEYVALVHPDLPEPTPSRVRDLAPRTLAMAFAYYGIREALGWRPSARRVLAWLEQYDARAPDRRDLIPACRLAMRAIGGEQLTPAEWTILARAEDDVRRVCERARPRLGRFEP